MIPSSLYHYVAQRLTRRPKGGEEVGRVALDEGITRGTSLTGIIYAHPCQSRGTAHALGSDDKSVNDGHFGSHIITYGFRTLPFGRENDEMKETQSEDY